MKLCFEFQVVEEYDPTSVLVKWCRVGQSGINSAREGLRDPLLYKTTKIVYDHSLIYYTGIFFVEADGRQSKA